MKKIILIIFVSVCMQTNIFAQVRDTIVLEMNADSTFNDTITTRVVGKELLKRSVSITNRCNVSVKVLLSTNKRTWKSFTITPREQKLFVIGRIKKVYLWIDPKRNPKTKYLIYKGDQYSIRWSSMEGNYMLKKR